MEREVTMAKAMAMPTKVSKRLEAAEGVKTMSMAETTNASTATRPTSAILLSTLTPSRNTRLGLMASSVLLPLLVEAVVDPAKM